MYCIMSRMKADLLNVDNKTPNDVQLFESENFAWIDFLWSALGRSGEVGALTETLYEHLLDEEQMKIFISQAAKNLAKRCDSTGCPDFMEEKILKSVLEFVFSRISGGERSLKDLPWESRPKRGWHSI
jgi:hypothetical protein